jgi:hypothetical protein
LEKWVEEIFGWLIFEKIKVSGCGKGKNLIGP